MALIHGSHVLSEDLGVFAGISRLRPLSAIRGFQSQEMSVIKPMESTDCVGSQARLPVAQEGETGRLQGVGK